MATILIVDDEAAIREAIAMLLSSEGHTVRAAHDGAAALDVIGRDRINLIVSDVMMPHVSGYQLVAELRQRGDGTPAILMSAGAHPVCVLPAVRCFSKPFVIDDFLAAIDDLLAERE